MGQVGHALLTRSPLSPPGKARWIPFDLHVLSTPPAFILSQNRTLHKKTFMKNIRIDDSQNKKSTSTSLRKDALKKTSPLIKPSRVPDHHTSGQARNELAIIDYKEVVQTRS